MTTKTGERRAGPSYRATANDYLRTLVDGGATVDIDLAGDPAPMRGKLVAYDQYNVFVERVDGVPVMVNKGAIRTLAPVGKGRP